jgi:hypothetical protein
MFSGCIFIETISNIFVLMIVLVHMLCAVYFRNTIFLIKNDGLAS